MVASSSATTTQCRNADLTRVPTRCDGTSPKGVSDVTRECLLAPTFMSGFRSLFPELQLSAGRRKAAARRKVRTAVGVGRNPVLKHGAIFWSLKTRALETGTAFRTWSVSCPSCRLFGRANSRSRVVDRQASFETGKAAVEVGRSFMGQDPVPVRWLSVIPGGRSSDSFYADCYSFDCDTTLDSDG
jgi:hypothetical protein